MFKPVATNINFAQIEEEIIEYWKKNKTFEKSLEKDAPNGDWTFLDGPPFVTGMPHYGSLLSSLPKDVFGPRAALEDHPRSVSLNKSSRYLEYPDIIGAAS